MNSKHEVTHTPGPWKIGFRTDQHGVWELAIYNESHGSEVCQMLGFFKDKATNTADARLIAAAPELLVALQAIDRADTYVNERGEALLKVRKAITKATTGKADQ